MLGATSASEIILCSFPGCRRCQKVRAYLAEHRIAFNEVNVLLQPRVLLQFMRGTGRGLPALLVDGRCFSPVDRQMLTRLFPKRGR